MRTLGLDIGSKTVGLAISDPFNLIAQPLVTLERTSLDADIQAIMEVIDQYQVSLLVVGKPYHMNKSEGKSVQMVMNLANRLADKTGLELVYQDERLTTVSALDFLKDSGVRRENRKDHVDKIAASYILQTYLDWRNNGNN